MVQSPADQLLFITGRLEGEVQGDWSQLLVLAAISESPEYHAVSRSGSGVRVPMATFADALGVLSYQRVQAELAQTVPPD